MCVCIASDKVVTRGTSSNRIVSFGIELGSARSDRRRDASVERSNRLRPESTDRVRTTRIAVDARGGRNPTPVGLRNGSARRLPSPLVRRVPTAPRTALVRTPCVCVCVCAPPTHGARYAGTCLTFFYIPFHSVPLRCIAFRAARGTRGRTRRRTCSRRTRTRSGRARRCSSRAASSFATGKRRG